MVQLITSKMNSQAQYDPLKIKGHLRSGLKFRDNITMRLMSECYILTQLAWPILVLYHTNLNPLKQ